MSKVLQSSAPVTEVWAWVLQDPSDGGESVPMMMTEVDGLPCGLPLYATSKERALAFTRVASDAAFHTKMPIKLVRFVRVDD